MGQTAILASRDRRITVAGIVGFAAALTAASQVAIPVPGTSVPMTLQPLAVVLAGICLGPAAGAGSMVLYLAAGAAGLPVFAPQGLPGVARLLGPTGGYLVAYPLGAYAAGWIVRHGPRQFAWRALAAASGIALIHLGGVAQLAVLTGSLTRAFVLGSAPFLGMDAVKAVLAALYSPRSSGRAPA
jgi:biotin transport system substrate-specific component